MIKGSNGTTIYVKNFKTGSLASSMGAVQTRRRSISIVGVIYGRCTNKKAKTFRN